jgi:nicotinamidase-related amidase
LLVVDVLAGIFELPLPLAHPEPFLANVVTLVQEARAAGARVVFLRHRGRPPSPFAEGARGRQIHSAVAPLGDEPVIDKEHPDSFHATGLGQLLANEGVDAVVVCGFASEGCIDSTVRSAYGRGLEVQLASDAHTTTASRTLGAEQIVAHENEALARFAAVVPTAAVAFGSGRAPSRC